MGERVIDPGFGTSSGNRARRMVNSDGSFNIKYANRSNKLTDAYHYLINVSWLKFLILAFVWFLAVNVLFAIVYLCIGIDEITASAGNTITDFFKAFFFSAQTLTTLGYGSMSPNGLWSGIVSSIEAFIGLTTFAFLTGLLYGRFSKPKASIRFSKHIILRDFNHTKAIMFRLVNNRTTIMIKPKVSVVLALSKQNNLGNFTRSFYTLNLERDAITYLPSTWTVVHEIDDKSPLFNMAKDDIIKQHGELLIMISYYDQSFNQEVYQMHSYTLNEICLDHKFEPAYYYNSQGDMVLDYNRFDTITSVKS